MPRSLYILGRRKNRILFNECSPDDCIVVTCYRTYKGKVFYAAARYHGRRSEYRADEVPAAKRPQGGSLRYRVIVRPKRKVPE